MDSTVAEQAASLAAQVDFEKRSEAFGTELDALIQKHKVGIVINMSLANFSQSGTRLIFEKIEPYIQRVDLKKLEEAQAEAKKDNDTKKNKSK